MRKVSNWTFIDLLDEKKKFFRLGSVFTLASIFIMLPGVLFLYSNSFEPYQKYDTEAILSEGTTGRATITNISAIKNITVNGEHPLEITYLYDNDGIELEDRFQTMDFKKTANLKGGSIVNVKFLGNESIITDLESYRYRFPFEFILILPLIFLLVGIAFLIIALLPALKKYKLYRYGIPIDARFIRMTMFSSSPFGNDRMANVDYYYAIRGKNYFGTCTTKEFLPLSLRTSDDVIKIFVNRDYEEITCYIPKSAIDRNNWKIDFD